MLSPSDANSVKASDYIAHYLMRIGVQSAFGMTGGAITHAIDSVCRAGMRFYSFSHEQGAIFAASGATKSDNNIRVVFVTSGPGATNLITGIAEAFFDSVPMLIITGQVNTYDFKWDAACRQMGFQETDIVKIAAPITKSARLVSDANVLAEELSAAVLLALNGRPGPVLLDVPMDVQRAIITMPPVPQPVVQKVPPTLTDIASLTQTLSRSHRPVILLGNGCKLADCNNVLLDLINHLRIPVVVSLLGKGCIDEGNPNFVGFIGAYGNRYSNLALAHADVILSIGARFDSRQTGSNHALFADKAIIQVDIDPTEVGNTIRVSTHIHADARSFLLAMKEYLLDNPIEPVWLPWIVALATLRREHSRQVEFSRANADAFEYDVVRAISEEMPDDAALCADIGQVQMIAAQELVLSRGQQFITSGGMAPMGYALPAAIGIALETHRRVICVSGDGGIQVSIQELNIMARKALPILVIVMDNRSLGMVKQFQELYFEERYFATDEANGYYSADFAGIARAYGIPAATISNHDSDWRAKIATAFRQPWPFLLHVKLDYETKVYPKLRFDTTIDNPDPPLSKQAMEAIKRKLYS